MSDSVLGVGISIRCDDPDFKDQGPNLDEAESFGFDYVELPTLSMNLVAGGREISQHVRDAPSSATTSKDA